MTGLSLTQPVLILLLFTSLASSFNLQRSANHDEQLVKKLDLLGNPVRGLLVERLEPVERLESLVGQLEPLVEKELVGTRTGPLVEKVDSLEKVDPLVEPLLGR
jgi:hypothetical protein